MSVASEHRGKRLGLPWTQGHPPHLPPDPTLPPAALPAAQGPRLVVS